MVSRVAIPQAEKEREEGARAGGRAGAVRVLSAAALALVLIGEAAASRAEDGAGTAAAPSASAKPAEESEGLSPECRVPGSKLYALAGLKAVRAAIAGKRPISVLSVGSMASPGRLESALGRALPNVKVEVTSRGLMGEVASGAGERLRGMIAEVEPDLVVWQVGSSDALARVEIDAFAEALRETVQWIKSHGIDVLLVDPLFTESVADDADYTDLVRRVQEVAAQEGVPLVRRFEAMRFLSAGGDGEDDEHMIGRHFRLNNLGLRCMVEHVTRAITLSLRQPDASEPGASETEAAKPDIAKPDASAPQP